MVSWIPEDDLLLKNAAESGASLESLAKGAVRFSRKFTLRELQVRWHSLLYDPVVSEEASFRMAELIQRSASSTQTSKSGKPETDNSIDNNESSSSGKRESESVRSSFYSMLKRKRIETLVNPMDLSSLEEKNQFLVEAGGSGIEELHQPQELPGDSLVNEANDIKANQVFNSVEHGGPSTWATDESLFATAGIFDQMSNNSESIWSQYFPIANGGLSTWMTTDEGFSASASAIPADVGLGENNDLFDSTGWGNDHQTANTKGCNLDEITNILMNDEGFSMDANAKNMDKSNYFNVLGSILAGSFNNYDLYEMLNEGDDQAVTSEVLTSASQFPELTNGVICCTLNTEDPEIPCNDDIVFPTQSSPLEKDFSSAQKATDRQISDTLLPGKPLSHSSVASSMEKPVYSSAIRQEVDAAEKFLPPKSAVDHPAPPQPTPPNSEELLPSEAEREGDVPYSSDVEGMILDMDLLPHDHQDLGSHQPDEDNIRAIIRLEQSLKSSIQSAIASHGAFAVLYDGRHPKHYIKKPQTLLGRSSADSVVNIDLGREGFCGNKVSRRQAEINLEEDGSFHLTNLGRNCVSINGKQVAPGRRQVLNSDNLIEIRGVAFIFETNEDCVKQFLNGGARN